MNRLKLLAAAMLLAVPIACGDEVIPPPPTGSIDGLVSIEGQGIDAVSVTLSNGASAITANGGMYRFDGVEAGAYTVTISNYPDDASFNSTSAAATITTDGQNVTVNFPGTYIRTSSIMGTVTVDNEGLGGVTVTISGTGDSETLTDGNGQYAFTGLRAGNYTIEISGFDDEDVAFGSTSSSAVVGVGESKVVSFEGTYVRTSGIIGQITADEEPQEGITVSLQGRGENRSMTTNSAGQFSFDELRRGDYAVGISGYNTDEVSFDETSQTVTVAYGETANVPFEGTLLRTAGIAGTVTVEGVGPIAGVTVTISGEGESKDATTDNMGAYAFERLRAGEYSVVISGFDDDEYGFPDGTSATVTVQLQETETVPFDGIMLRTAAIEGTVTVGDDDAPLSGVMVTVSGGPRDEEHGTTTNGDGMYMVENLHAGTYSVTISGYDAKEYGFDPTTKTLTVDLRDTGEAAFQGELLRTAGVSGRVHVDGMGIPGVTVTMTGEESRQGTTDADGQYGFSGLAAGDYTITISDWDEVEYAFEPTMEIALELNESMSGVNFSGKALRTATVKGYVTVEGDALPGIAVTLIRVVSANSGEILGAAATGQNGGYSFGPLLAGAYQVMIAGYTDEHDFAAGTTQTTIVMTDSTATVNFAATINRTASVSGMVTVDGEAMAGVEVTLAGDHAPEDNTMMTGDDGGYSFGGLRKGDYTVSIENPDEDTYSFPSTSQALNLSVGQEQAGISFAGARLQQASISGQVHAEHDPVEGVMVTLSGDADGEDMTDANGEYNFPSLAGGDYTVTITGWDEDAYEFATTEAAVAGLGTDEFKIVDFAGTHTRTASIGGMLFIDEGGATALARDEGEPVLDLDDVLHPALPGLPITLLGPELGDVTQGSASREGMYAFDSLRAGAYVLNIDVEMEVTLPPPIGEVTIADLLAHYGYEYTGPSLITVTVAAAEESDANNLPFKITMQTINVGAVMGTPDAATETMVGGVELALYPTAEAADAGEPMLGTATTGADPEMPSYGIATFHFPRAMDLGPGGTGNDHLVFAKVVSAGHDDLEFSDNKDIEIQYAATDRVSNAHAAARLVNVQVNFQWWAKSNETAKDGNMVLGGWVANNEMATDATGLATYSGSITVDEAIAGAEYEVMLAEEQHDSVTGKERWMQSDALTHEHNHLALPAENTSEMNDLGPIYVTWTTQSLTLGVYREADDVEGFTDRQSELAGGDHRPHSEVGSGMTVDLMTRDSRNRLRVYDEWDHDCDDDGEKEMPTEERDATGNFAAGMITFRCLPADEQFTVRYNAGDDREQMDYDYDEIETFGNDLDHGVTLGAFGAMSGAGPEVRMCSASDPTNADATSDEWTDEWCATFAYQWETGMVHGKVGSESGHDIAVDPETGHGAIGDSDTTRAGGNYAFTGLQDGVYTATAASTDAKYQLLGPAEEEGIALYHNEACWAATNPDPATGDERPSACAANEVIEGEDDDGNTTYTYANGANVSWDTGRLGLAIRGYVANDGQDGEDRDGLLRGDESMAGIEMTLYNSTNKARVAGVDPVETDASGFYQFENLKAGTYTVRAGTASNARAIVSITQNSKTKVWSYVNARGNAVAEDYTLTRDEADLPKPYWDRANTTGGSMGQGTTTVTGTGTNPASDKYYNFALVYTDGELSGRVNNLSGSNASIDIIISTPSPLDDDEKVETVGSRGNFELGDLIEAMGYTAEIEDAGFTAPCMGADGMPDDDLEADDGTCGPGNSRFPTELEADIEGESDHESMGTLTVYNTRMSSADAMTAIEVMGQTEVGKDEEDLADGVTIGAQSTDATAVSVRTGPITFASESVTVDATVSGDADVVVMMGDKMCAAGVCELDFNKTGSDETSNASTEITVMVTAENGYDDHAYTFSVSRTNPVDNVLERGEILTQDGRQAGGSGGDGETAGNPWQVTTASEDSAAITLTFNLEEIGTGDDVICGQSISVKINGGADQDAINDTDNDACDDEQYRLSAATSGTVYEITITSQDDVAKKYYINLRRAAGSVNEAPEVTTEIPDQSLSVNATRDVDVASNFSDPNDDDDLTFTAESDATGTVTVTVNESLVTITGVAEGSAEITVTATDPGGLTVTDAFSVTVQAASANEAPEVATPIDDQTVKVGATTNVDVENNFSDADMDNLTFTAVSDATGTATVTVSGSLVTITGVAVGNAEITVTANDGNGGTVDDAFSVTVEPASVNQAPEVATAIDDQTVEVGATEEVDVENNFSDADMDNLEFTAASDDQTKATVSVTGSLVTITGVAEGTANITVTADDGNGGTVDDAFEVTVSVPNQAPEVATAIDDQSLEAGETKEVDVENNFSDADMDNLTFTAVSDDDTKATVTVTGSMLTITGVAVGDAEITVTADDGNGGTVEDAFDVTVTPTSPAVRVSIEEATVLEETERDYTVWLAAQPSDGDVTVAIVVAAPDGATDTDVSHVTTTRTSLTFTEQNWNRARTVTISVADDTDEDSEMAEVTHTPSGNGNYASVDPAVIMVTAQDDDVVAGAGINAATSITVVEEATDGAELMVKLDAEPTGDVTVSATLDPVSGVAGIESGDESLTFTTLNWNTEQGITITGTADDDPVDAEAKLTLDASGGGYGSAEDVEVTVNVDDDEDATISIADDVSGAEVLEGGTMTYNVTLSAPPPTDETVRVNLSVTGPASVSPAQAVFESNTADNSVTITVTPFSDSDMEDEDVTISHSVDATDGSGYESATAPSNVSVKIKDDEAAGVVVSRTMLSVDEGQTVTYTVRLTTAPSADETVTINLAGTGVNLDETSLEFTDGNFSTVQTVTVTGHVDGDDQDDDASVVHTVTTTGGDEDYDGVTASTVNITVKEPSDE